MSQELSKDKDCNVAQKVNTEENRNLVQMQSEYSAGLFSSTGMWLVAGFELTECNVKFAIIAKDVGSVDSKINCLRI